MPIFNSPTDFSDHKKYVELLKKALVVVLPGTKAHFIYYKEYPFADKKRPCVLVDFGPKCLDQIKAASKLTPTATGKVTLNLSNQLQFMPEHGEFKVLVVKKEFETMGAGIKEVYVDPKEAGAPGEQGAVQETAPQKTAPLRTPQISPHLATGALRQPGAPQPSGAPPKGAAAAGAAAVAQMNAPPQVPPKPARPAAAAPVTKPTDMPVVTATFPIPKDETQQEALAKKLIGSLAKAKLPITDDHKKTLLDKAQSCLKADDFAHAIQIANALARTVTYPGIPDWVLDGASRKNELELFVEKCTAINFLIQQKSAGSNQWDAETAAANRLAKLAGNCKDILDEGLAEADPAKVKAHYEAWLRLEQDRKKLTGLLKPIWFADQDKRMLAEAGKSKASHNIRMANAYGKEAMLEMAQMAEVQAVQYKKSRPTDPLAQGDWHKKLEVAELAAIYGYSTADYTAVGKLLRAKQDTLQQPDALKPLLAKYDDYIKAAVSGLAKLPPYTGKTLVRCTKSLWQETIDEIAQSGVHVEKSFMSVGTKAVPAFGGIEWHIEKSTTGKEISMFSLHQSEGEILFPPGSRFRFVKGKVADPKGGRPIEFSNHAELANHVTPETKAGVFAFEQVG
jgi:hypothetical protein